MRLRKVTIKGFKSYMLETVVDNLNAKHNVIVGGNGSGKSNFFSAIEFVLSNTYRSLPPEQRVSLINNGSSKNLSDTAFVEIVFDQSPISERSSSSDNCTCIRRTISATKDQYMINGRNATRKELDELLDSLGPSTSNSHNIVKQDTIHRIATSSPQQLLELLYETGGIRSFDDSLKLDEKQWQAVDKKLQQIRNYRTAIAKQFELLPSTCLSQELSVIDRTLTNLEVSQKLLLESIQLLRDQRLRCVEQTFASVNRKFGEIFKKLVPTGCGLLSLQTVDEEAGGVAEEHNLAEGGGTAMERYVGLRLEVSFHLSNGEVMHEMNALSGGQKKLAAIALLFAMHRHNPANFYLFDGIDQSLDDHHRKVIADEIAAQSASSQILCTTLRWDLANQADKCFGVQFRNDTSLIDQK